MKTVNKVFASSQVESTLPLWIRSPDVVIQGNSLTSYSQETHRNFVSFMTTSGESQERIGFGQDLLQNLLKYSDFDFYQNQIIPYNFLKVKGSVGLFSDQEEQILLTGTENPLIAVKPLGDALALVYSSCRWCHAVHAAH